MSDEKMDTSYDYVLYGQSKPLVRFHAEAESLHITFDESMPGHTVVVADRTEALDLQFWLARQIKEKWGGQFR